MSATMPSAGEAAASQDVQMQVSQWKQSMGQFAAGVVVVTARDASGEPVGTTVSAFSSLSLQPRLLLVCLNRQSRTLAAIRQSGCFAVNVLAAGEAQLAFKFGRKGADKFAGVSHVDGVLGCPLLGPVCTRVECHLEAIHAGGDHDILVGRPEQVEVMADKGPLVYHAGRFLPEPES
jgi:flavin reductase (DIM6/NTAB) family NADH-FMN oxidoreductase RutF